MIVMEIFMPSGFDSEKESLHNIVGTHKSKITYLQFNYALFYQSHFIDLKKIEEFSNKVVFYFTDLFSETVCIPFNISRTTMVSKLYNSSIWLYEYYNPDHQIIKVLIKNVIFY